MSSELDAVRLSLNIFLDATYDLLSSINMFKGESERHDFWRRAGRPDLERLELRIQRGIFSAAAAAMALVDHSRKLNTRYPVELYQEKIDKDFAKDPLHRFIQKLRDFMAHVRIVESNRFVKWDRQGKNVFFILTAKDLNKCRGWDAPSKFYIVSIRKPHIPNVHAKSSWDEITITHQVVPSCTWNSRQDAVLTPTQDAVVPWRTVCPAYRCGIRPKPA